MKHGAADDPGRALLHARDGSAGRGREGKRKGTREWGGAAPLDMQNDISMGRNCIRK